MTGRAKKAAVPKKKANGYKMPAPIALGEVIHDTTMKKKWRIGPSIGVGGFGEIYSACDHDSTPKGTNYPFVVKIEPHENGPLFVEKHFYIRNAKMDDITAFMKSKKLSSLGMPSYYGNGSHDYKGEKYRYLVLERYGKDLWSLFTQNGRSFPAATVFQIGLQMLDVLEYIHSRGYVHADIKGANILLGLKRGSENQAYLVDFGLATRVNDKEFKPDPKCAHNGTIEYTSRDAHLGVATMRGDLEILGYNMLQWLCGELPWEKSLKQPKVVQDMKEAFMKSVRSSITKLSCSVPDALIKFFEYINTLKPKEVPDYNKCRQFFESYLKSQGITRSSKLVFTQSKKKSKTAVKSITVDDDSDEEPLKKPQKKSSDSKVIKRRKPKAKEESSEAENEEPEEPLKSITIEDDSDEEPLKKRPQKKNSNSKVTKRRKPKPKEESPEAENGENEEPEEPVTAKQSTEKIQRKPKRKSSEPSLVVKVKKTKLAPKATPPLKKNQTNMATQTSLEKLRRSPRQVSFDSPICEIIDDKKPLKRSKDNEPKNTSADIFEDSFEVENNKVKPKKKGKILLSDEEYTETKVVKKKITTVKKGRSWKEAPTVLNGRSPPK